jgi:hypothetical protein
MKSYNYHPFFETIDIQETREILDTLLEKFDDSSEEAIALNMAIFSAI